MIEKRLSDMACNPDFVQFIIDQIAEAKAAAEEEEEEEESNEVIPGTFAA